MISRAEKLTIAPQTRKLIKTSPSCTRFKHCFHVLLWYDMIITRSHVSKHNSNPRGLRSGSIFLLMWPQKSVAIAFEFCFFVICWERLIFPDIKFLIWDRLQGAVEMSHLRAGLVFSILDEKKTSSLNCGITENNTTFLCILITLNTAGSSQGKF